MFIGSSQDVEDTAVSAGLPEGQHSRYPSLVPNPSSWRERSWNQTTLLQNSDKFMSDDTSIVERYYESFVALLNIDLDNLPVMCHHITSHVTILPVL